MAVNLEPAADNRIHDDDVAQSFGFTGALVPGVELFALATAPLVRAWGEAFLSSGRLQVRFRRPVYDGERVRVTVGPDLELALSGPDGDARTVGTVGRPAPQEPPTKYDTAPLPTALAAAPHVGPFGSFVEDADPAAAQDYARRIGDDHPAYEQLVHPGLLLRLVNAALMRNVALGPWIHTGSDCRLLGTAPYGSELEVRSRVTEVFSRNGHDRVRYDALITADGRPVAEVHHEAIWRLGGQETQA